eukprot:10527389-Alexandrium_andersonii.AAC.1
MLTGLAACVRRGRCPPPRAQHNEARPPDRVPTADQLDCARWGSGWGTSLFQMPCHGTRVPWRILNATPKPCLRRHAW